MKARPTKSKESGKHATNSASFSQENSSGVGQASFFSDVQAELEFGKADDPLEREADTVAERVISKNTLPENASFYSRAQDYRLQRQPEEKKVQREEEKETVQRKREEEGMVQQKSEGSGKGSTSSASFSAQLSGAKGGGVPLSGNARANMEQGFGTDFGEVRIHTGATAQNLSSAIGAKAFTHGRDIFFNEGRFSPGSPEGDRLLAHELTHTMQQGAVAGSRVSASATNPAVQADLLDDIIGFFEEYADDIPGYRLFIVVIGYDPLRDEDVERNAENWFRGFISVIPGADAVFRELKQRGLIDKAEEVLKDIFSGFNISLKDIKDVLESIWENRKLEFLTDAIDILVEEFRPLKNKAVNYANTVLDRIFTLIKDALIDPLVELAKETKGYELLTKVLGKDPISGEKVEATTEEMLEDFLLLIGKEEELKQMKKRGALKRTADWLDKNVDKFFHLLSQLKNTFLEVWKDFDLQEWLKDPLEKLEKVVEKFEKPVSDFLAFAWEVAKKVLKFIKDALLSWLGRFLKDNLRGFHLLTVILGKDPITGKPVERTGENLILGFLSLILSDERIQEIKKTGAIQQTIDWIMAKVDQLGLTFEGVVQLFKDIWNAFTIEDLIKPVEAFTRVMKKFGKPVLKVLNFVKEVVLKVVEVILLIMEFPVGVVQSIIANTAQAFEDIKRDPIQFFLNLLKAVKKGFKKFFDNIVGHLLDGVKAWLFRQLEKANIDPPKDLSLQSTLELVMDVLGINPDKIFAMVEEKIGKEKMEKIKGFGDKLTGIWTFVNDIIQGGPAAIWEKIQEQLGNLWDIVIGFIQDWIMEKVINKVMAKLLSMLDPSGIMAVVNSVMLLYDTIRSAVEYFKDMLEIVNSFVGGVAEIARGSLDKAAKFLEGSLAQAIPVAIGFLANLIGLDDLSKKLRDILNKVRKKVDEVLGWLIGKAVDSLGALVNALGGKEASTTENDTDAISKDPKKAAKVAEGLAAVPTLEKQYLTAGRLSREEADKVAKQIRKDYPVFKTFKVVDGGDSWNYFYEASPGNTLDTPSQKEEKKKPIDLGLKKGEDVVIKPGKKWVRAEFEEVVPASEKVEGATGFLGFFKHAGGKFGTNTDDINKDLSSKDPKKVKKAGTITPEVERLLNNRLFKVGPGFDDDAKRIDSSGRKVTDAERMRIQPIGDTYGGHHGGTKGKDENWVADHQPVSELLMRGLVKPGKQRLYPQSPTNSSRQGSAVIEVIKVAFGHKK